MALQHLLSGLLEYATNEQGSKSVAKALKDGGKDTLNRIIQRMCEPTKGFISNSLLLMPQTLTVCFSSARRAMLVDLALSVTGSQLIASALPNVCPYS
jgi:pumilio RNA-binding family